MTLSSSDTALALEDLADQSVSEIGHKAHTLARLSRAGFNVPRGIVIPSRIDPSRLGPILEDIAERLAGPLAVRSSGVAEDEEGRSFAGQYETVLWVDGIAGLVEATKRVAGSGGSERVRSYAGDEDTSGVAVLIQQMVPADAAGVAFTADPVTGERGVTIVSSVRGVGERLASGEADPDEWEVRGDEVGTRRTPENSLTEPQVREVARLAEQVADELGRPQDIEWAMAGGDLWLLQSRPITGLPGVMPIEPDIEVPEEGFWMRDGGHYPSPISPMAASFYLPALEEQSSKAFREWGLLLERVDQRVIGWWVYGRPVPPGGKDGPAPPWWLMGILARIVPPIRRQVKRARESFESGRMESVIDRWWNEWRPEFRQRIDALLAVELAGLDDAELIAHLDRTIELVDHGQQVHFDLFPPYMLTMAESVRFCEEQLGWSKAKATELVAGLSEMSSEPARRLSELGRLARSGDETSRLLERVDVTLDEMREADRHFAQALDSYLAEFGVRATAYDVIAPTLGEQDHLLVTAIRSEGGYDPVELRERHAETRALAKQEALAQLAGDAGATAAFGALMQRLERVYPVREDNIFFTDNAPLGLVRLVALEIGRRLTDRELLDDPEQVVFLTIDEAKDALKENHDHRDRVDRRRGERAWAETRPAPPSYGEDPGPPPDMRAMPQHVRRLMDALMFFMENDLTAPQGDGLTGTAASAGSYVGPVRVIRSESEFEKVRPGDVLVCPITTPAWSVLFGQIGALVTDTGGLLSHSAIVAREHGIPAVVATGSATSMLRDGQLVSVDGSRGHIEIQH